MIGVPRRVVLVGSVIVDVTAAVPRLERGGESPATDGRAEVAGGFAVLAAAARLGLPAALAGHVGAGPLGQLVRATLAAEGIASLLPPAAGEQGCRLALIEPGGERTLATAPGVEAQLHPDDLAGVRVEPGDVICVRGHDLLSDTSGPAIAGWLDGLPPTAWVFFDPGPLVAEIPDAVLDAVLPRVDVLGLNAREMALLSGEPVVTRTPEILGELRADAVVLIRDGAHPTLLVRPGRSMAAVPTHRMDGPVLADGAGDTHTGAFLAELARGADLEDATRVANVAAALSLRSRDCAVGPTRQDLDAALAAARVGVAGA